MSAPYMNLYIADYLGDTQHLTTEQHGAYLLLLMAMWRHGGSLPNDQAKLARIARVNLRRWHIVGADVMPFFEVRGEQIVQKRLEREHQKAHSLSEKRSVIGKLGGEAKALKSKEQALPIASDLLGDTRAGYQNQISEPERKEEGSLREPRAREPDAILPEFDETFWPAYPNKTAKPKALASFRAARRAVTLETIMAGLDRYIATKPPDRQWLNPTTFLNQRRFDDQPAFADATGRPTGARNGTGYNGKETLGDILRATQQEIERLEHGDHTDADRTALPSRGRPNGLDLDQDADLIPRPSH